MGISTFDSIFQFGVFPLNAQRRLLIFVFSIVFNFMIYFAKMPTMILMLLR